MSLTYVYIVSFFTSDKICLHNDYAVLVEWNIISCPISCYSHSFTFAGYIASTTYFILFVAFTRSACDVKVKLIKKFIFYKT